MDTDSNDEQRLWLNLSYDGTDFWGWQKQSGPEATVQGTLEKILSQIFDRPIAVVGSGRTDRGVHALNQWAHADVPASMIMENLPYRLQRMSPDTLRIKSVALAPQNLHAQISAEKKRYVYRIWNRREVNPFFLRYCWPISSPLNMNFLQAATNEILGEQDFAAFQSTGTEVTSTVREIFQCRWQRRSSGFLDFHIVGNGFLKQMVRNIVGTLIQLQDQDDPVGQLRMILNSANRRNAGAPAPAQGLFLASVKYPQELDIKCRKL